MKYLIDFEKKFITVISQDDIDYHYNDNIVSHYLSRGYTLEQAQKDKNFSLVNGPCGIDGEMFDMAYLNRTVEDLMIGRVEMQNEIDDLKSKIDSLGHQLENNKLS